MGACARPCSILRHGVAGGDLAELLAEGVGDGALAGGDGVGGGDREVVVLEDFADGDDLGGGAGEEDLLGERSSLEAKCFPRR
jgi:hypothetical protein